jgi:hypothetical protein
MPTITGDLQLVTQIPAGATHLHIHAPQTRVTGSTVILTDPDIIQVKPDGTFTTTIEPGEAICIPAYSGTMGLPIPILVKPETTTFAEAVRNAGNLTADERDSVITMYHEIVASQQAAAAAASRAGAKATEAAVHAQAAAKSATEAAAAIPPATATTQGKIRLAGDLTGTADNPKIITAGNSAWSITADAHPAKAGFVKTQPDGQIHIETPSITSYWHAVNKKYVDNQINTRAPSQHTHRFQELQGLPTTFINPKVTGSLNSFMVRDDNGRAEVNEPTTAKEIANKQYVDSEIAKISTVYSDKSPAGELRCWRIGRMVFINIREASSGRSFELPNAFHPIDTVDFLLTVPNRRDYPGWCNVLASGQVTISFSGTPNSADRGYGCATYMAATSSVN